MIQCESDAVVFDAPSPHNTVLDGLSRTFAGAVTHGLCVLLLSEIQTSRNLERKPARHVTA